MRKKRRAVIKEHIYTIPVISGFKEKGECPFCNMYETLNRNTVDFMLGPSYMEDDIRMQTNKTGFCKRHYNEMYAEKNRLGLALMVQTHMQRIIADLSGMAGAEADNGKRSVFAKKTAKQGRASVITEYLNRIGESCYVCDKINGSFDRYIDTFFYLWKTDKHIVDFVKESDGFCIEHFAVLLARGETKLNPKDFNDFLDVALPKQIESLKKLEGDIDWFIKKFDYRFNDEPWKNSKDALPRALQKVGALTVRDE